MPTPMCLPPIEFPLELRFSFLVWHRSISLCLAIQSYLTSRYFRGVYFWLSCRNWYLSSLEQPLKIVNGPKDPSRKPTANSAENLFALLYAQGICARCGSEWRRFLMLSNRTNTIHKNGNGVSR